jgi:flagellar biogenesis protein FliO
MGGYIANFTVYTMAMIGLICFAIFVYKKFTDGTMRSGDGKFLEVEESMSLSPRKTLHVVRAGNEKFLIASDVDRTTLISKLTPPQKMKAYEPEIDYSEKSYNQDVINIYKQNEQIKEQKQPDYVHLEPLQPKVKMDRREKFSSRNQNKLPQKTVTLDFEASKNHGVSPMKEMAMKINEL